MSFIIIGTYEFNIQQKTLSYISLDSVTKSGISKYVSKFVKLYINNYNYNAPGILLDKALESILIHSLKRNNSDVPFQ